MKLKEFKIIKVCKICKSNNLKLIFRNNPSPIGEEFLNIDKKKKKQKKYPIDYMCCQNCGLLQIKHFVNSELVYPDYLYETKTSPTLNSYFEKSSNKLKKKLKLNSHSSILEIGSNDGTLLKKFKKTTQQLIGIEPSKHISKKANNDGIYTINQFLNKNSVNVALKKNKNKFDLVIATNVIANIENLHEVFKNIKKLIKEKGYFVFETFYLYSLIKNKVFDFLYHEHLYLFGIKPIEYLCKIYKLKVHDIELLPTKGGSIRFYISNANQHLKQSKNLKKLKTIERKNKVYNKTFFLKLNNKRELEKNKLISFLKKEILSKKRIIGFGASISCITFIYDFKIENKFNFLVDDNSLKFNLYSPGSKIKVCDPLKFNFRKDDVIVILAWRYKNMILSKYKKIFKNKIVLEVWPKFKILVLK